MTLFRFFLVFCFIAIAAYSVVAIANQGPNLFPYAVRDIAAMGWPGQFNVDFLTYLALSGLWVAWRHDFSGLGIFLGFLAFNGGMLFLSVYLIIHSYHSNGDVRILLLGRTRAQN